MFEITTRGVCSFNQPPSSSSSSPNLATQSLNNKFPSIQFFFFPFLPPPISSPVVYTFSFITDPKLLLRFNPTSNGLQKVISQCVVCRPNNSKVHIFSNSPLSSDILKSSKPSKVIFQNQSQTTTIFKSNQEH